MTNKRETDNTRRRQNYARNKRLKLERAKLVADNKARKESFEIEWSRRCNNRKKSKRSRGKGKPPKMPCNVRVSQSQNEFESRSQVIRLFEKKCRDLKHHRCTCCCMVTLNMEVNGKGICSSCSRLSDKSYFLNKRLLPIWFKGTEPQYELPPELQDLTHAEKMLIQRVSPVIPLHHMKNGVFGLSGHVCAFEQDIKEMASVLPRFARETSVLRVLQEIKSEIGGTSSCTRTFTVRRQKVLKALLFLQKHNREYADIQIDESRLDWIDGDEGDLDAFAISGSEVKTREDDNNMNADMGPCSEQCLNPERTGDSVHAFGYADEGGIGALAKEDIDINRELQHAVSQSPHKRKVHMEWPAIAEAPISEYDDIRIFPRAFPWLFPGGYGDIKDVENADENMTSWGRRLLYYQDGRFAKDKLFCFYAQNYITRHRNSSSGKFFIERFQQNVPETLEDLKASIAAGDMRFVNHLTYYNKRIKGSTPYWFQKRAEVYAWVNEHMQMGHGAPTFFITLSCAEYFWADVINLLKDRFDVADITISDCHVGSPKLVQLVNDYTIVIQEYFQKRTELWLQTVGSTVFGIKHYWVRYEFAPGRGQIHAHLLAIPTNHDVFVNCHSLLQQDDGEAKRAHYLAEWAQATFGLTASVDPAFDPDSENTDPVTVRFTDLKNEDAIDNDAQQLLHKCQMHQCSDFCLRAGNASRKNRICKVGCGVEEHLGKADTPGFELRGNASVKFDHKRAKKLMMPRNHPRLNQSSTTLLQSWRGNCDIQILVYDSDPRYPSLAEIARVTDYVVAYACKGNSTVKEEREQNKQLILASDDVSGCKQDIRRVCRQVMNKTVSKRIISKQEATVLLADLDLFTCTETIESVSISNAVRLTTSSTPAATKTFIKRYASRPSNFEHMSLRDYFHHCKNSNPKSKYIIPNFVGVSGTPCYPVSTDYARHTLIVHKPWRQYPSGCDWVAEFNHFINSPSCPAGARIPYDRVMQRYFEQMTNYEPKSFKADHSNNDICDDDLELLHLTGMKADHEYDAEDVLFRNMDKGLHFPWDATPKTRNLADDNILPENWLKAKIEVHEEETRVTLNIPLKDDGTEYTIDDLYADQKEVVAIIIKTLHDFVTMEDLSLFKPLRLIVNGQGGSGKSVVINTIVTVMRKMFGFNDVIRVVAPTGVAAFNVHGETFHHLFHMGVSKGEYKTGTMSRETRKKLVFKFKALLALIVDERSLVSSKVLGTAEHMASETMHGGGYHMQDSWGGLPIVVLVGDDYQLPGIGEGPFTALLSRYGSKMNFNGRKALLECAKFVVELGGSKRVRKNQNQTKALLDRLRVGTDIEETDIDKLLSLHLDRIRQVHGEQEVDAIEDKAMFLFYKNDKRIRHNMKKLAQKCSPDNPVAVIKSRSSGSTTGKAIRSHFDTDIPSASLICTGAKVAINSRNFQPSWGLHNGACGTVDEIVFAEGGNPNNGDMPLYVVVEFPLYCGPAWDNDNPKLVPIPTQSFRCSKRCCERHFCPLSVAYARTIHKFQGLSAGPVDPGRTPNMYEVVVCDPDEKSCEGLALGLLYTAVSRGTTLGDECGLNSAVYFTGSSFTADRIRKLTFKANSNKEFEAAIKRRIWVNHIHMQTKASEATVKAISSMQHELFAWATSSRFCYDDLHVRINMYNHRSD